MSPAAPTGQTSSPGRRSVVQKAQRRLVRTIAARSARFQKVAWPLYHLPGDLLDLIPGRRDALTPSARQLRRGFIGGADFKAVGEDFVRHYTDLCGLEPHHRVLDVGCGLGRMAVPLTKYLRPPGSYEGIDIVPRSIAWCTDHITRRYPSFRFQVADVQNTLYNPTGAVAGSEYRFPFEDSSFDMISVVSVFTHMLPEQCEQYLAETARVLKPGGRGCTTWFLMNDESRAAVASGTSLLPFEGTGAGYWVMDPANPELAVAFEEQTVREWLDRHGLELEEPVRYGSWPSRTDFLSVQDMLIVRPRTGSTR